MQRRRFRLAGDQRANGHVLRTLSEADGGAYRGRITLDVDRAAA
jgi:hypothetical protein